MAAGKYFLIDYLCLTPPQVKQNPQVNNWYLGDIVTSQVKQKPQGNNYIFFCSTE